MSTEWLPMSPTTTFVSGEPAWCASKGDCGGVIAKRATICNGDERDPFAGRRTLLFAD